MRKFLVTILILLFSNTSFADINVNNCDNLEKQSEKLSCLTKLKAKALKENSTEKVKIIQKKLSNFHEFNQKNVEKTEKGVANTGKTIGKKISETDKQIREKSKETLDLLKNKIKKKE